MRRLRRHLPILSRLALLAWVAAFVLMTVQGCFADEGTGHEVLQVTIQHDHASSADALCAQHCAQVKATVTPSAGSALPNPSAWVMLLVLPLLLLLALGNHAIPPRRFPRLFAPPDPAARLLFVRFNH
ncbi:hypothetical protein [Chitinimonas naiadis]